MMILSAGRIVAGSAVFPGPILIVRLVGRWQSWEFRVFITEV